MKNIKLLFAVDEQNKAIADSFRAVPIFTVAFCAPQRLEMISSCMLTKPDAVVLCASDGSQVSENISALLKLSEHTEIFVMKLGWISLDYPLPNGFKLLDGAKPEAAAEELIFKSRFFEQDLGNSERTTEDPVVKAIDELGFTADYIGMMYVSDALSAILNGEISVTNVGFCKIVYPYIARLRQVSPASVERSMRTAIAKSWERVGDDVKDKYFGMAFRGLSAPSNRAYVLIVVEKLRRGKH